MASSKDFSAFALRLEQNFSTRITGTAVATTRAPASLSFDDIVDMAAGIVRDWR